MCLSCWERKASTLLKDMGTAIPLYPSVCQLWNADFLSQVSLQLITMKQKFLDLPRARDQLVPKSLSIVFESVRFLEQLFIYTVI